MKTIRQIADEIGVSKQTVYKRYKGKLHTVCAPYAHTEQGVLYIEEQGETLIKQDFLQKECSVGAHTYAHTERSNGEVLEQSENVGVIAVLQTTIDTLQGQLAIKDKQIEDLNARLSESNAALVAAQQTAQAAQALHAGTIQQQLTSGTDPVSYTHLDVYKRQIMRMAENTIFPYRFKCIMPFVMAFMFAVFWMNYKTC